MINRVLIVASLVLSSLMFLAGLYKLTYSLVMKTKGSCVDLKSYAFCRNGVEIFHFELEKHVSFPILLIVGALLFVILSYKLWR